MALPTPRINLSHQAHLTGKFEFGLSQSTVSPEITVLRLSYESTLFLDPEAWASLVQAVTTYEAFGRVAA